MKINYFKNFKSYFKDNMKQMLIIFILTGLNQVCCFLLPTAMAKLIDVGIKKNGFEDIGLKVDIPEEIVRTQTIYILKMGALMLLIALVSLVLTILIYRMTGKVSSKISMQLRKDVFSKIMNLSYAQKNEFSTSYLITCLLSDIEHVQNLITMCTQFVVPPLMLIGGIIMSLRICVSFTWIILLGGIIAGAIAFSCLIIVSSKANELQKTQDKFNLTIREQLQGMMIIRGFSNSKFEEKRFEKSNSNFARVSLFINKVTAIMTPLLSIFSNFFTVLTIWLSALKINGKFMQVGQVVAFMQYTMMVIGAFIIISLMISMTPALIVSVRRVSKILNCEQPSEEHLKDLPTNFKGKIKLKNVYFKYPSLVDYSLKNINLEIEYGKTLGIIGTIGSGKSTLLKLILGFYAPQRGEILFENEDLKNLKKKSIIKNISYVSQKDALFSGSIASNLKFSGSEENKVEEALRTVGLEKFIREKSMEFSIVNAGKNISGGQKQRLTLARSLLKDSNIYIFDDVFSNLDFKTEFLVREAIFEKLKGKTVILVSQRIGTIKNADNIIVMDKNIIIGMGSHQELIKKCEIYKKIAFMQEDAEVKNERS